MAIELISPESSMPTGTIISSSLQTAPIGFLVCDGSNTVSRSSYANLFNVIVPNKGTVTITSANPGVVTLNSHGFLTGESIFLITTGNLPTNLTANTLYYVINNTPTDTANTFRLATTYANAIAGTAINTTAGTQSGMHTLFYCPYGLGSTTSDFKLPDFKNATIRGRGLSTAFTNNDTTRLGNLENDASQDHKHNDSGHNHSLYYWVHANGGSNVWGLSNAGPVSSQEVSGWIYNVTNYANITGPVINSAGTPRTANETRMKNQGVNFFIKF